MAGPPPATDSRSRTGYTRGGWYNAAAAHGLTIAEYAAKRAAGEKFCRRCREWRPEGQFHKDASRGDGLKTICIPCTASKTPSKDRKRGKGPKPAPERDGDKLQARRRINVLVRTGRLPRPSDLPCTDCGQRWRPGQARHEYDHHEGYATGNHMKVQAVCARCHHAREKGRKTNE